MANTPDNLVVIEPNKASVTAGNLLVTASGTQNTLAQTLGTAGRSAMWKKSRPYRGVIRPATGVTTASGANSTVCSAFVVPGRPRYIRIIHMNEQPTSYPYAAVSFAVSSGFAAGTVAATRYSQTNYADVAYDSTGTANAALWVPCTYNNAGAFLPLTFPQATGTTTSFTIPANTGGLGQYVDYASDWMPVSVAPARLDGGYGYLVFVHAYGGSGVGTRYMYGLPQNITGTLNSGGCYINGDHASTAQNTASNGSLSCQAAFAVEFICDSPVFGVATVGDSILEGHGTVSQKTGVGILTMQSLQTAGVPASTLTESYVGRVSTDFITNGFVALNHTPATVALIQGVSENDLGGSNATQAQIDIDMGNALALVSYVASLGIVPILCTCAPFNTGSVSVGGLPTTEPLRRTVNTYIRSLSSGILVLDLDAILSTFPNSGIYRAGFGYSDGIHPNDAGMSALNLGAGGYPGLLTLCNQILGLSQ